MQVLTYNSLIKLPPSVLILGAFDAIHYGHLQLLNRAKNFNLPLTITLFVDPTIIPSKKIQWLYTPLNVKLEQLASLGIDNVILIDFNQIKHLQGQTFIQHIVKLANAQYVVVGENFAYGKNRHNNIKDLKRIFSNTVIVPDFKFKNHKVSTSLLKQLVILGEVDTINHLSPFPYTIEVNLTVDSTLKPAFNQLHHGIYAILIEINKMQFYGILSRGFNRDKVLIPDFKEKIREEILVKIKVISLVRPIISLPNQEINDEDFAISKNKLITYLKNRI